MTVRTVTLLTAAALALPAAAHAQDGGIRAAIARAADVAVSAAPAPDAEADANQTARPAPAQTVPDAGSKRRGSMVGYIDDATVSSKIRVRFDAGDGIDGPDRAEFFYAKCGCYRGLPASNAAFDPNAPGPGPGIATDLNFRQFYVRAEAAVKGRFSVFAELPVRSIEPQSFVAGTGSFPNATGLSDITIGVKASLMADANRDLTFQFRTIIPSGDAGKGLGTNHWSVEPMLLYHQRLTDRVDFESQIGDWHPTGGSAGVPTSGAEKFSADVIIYGAGASYDLMKSGHLHVAPVLELVGWRVTGGFQTGLDGSAQLNVVNLKLGARATMANGNSLYVGYGWALTSAVWYDHIIRLEYRYGF